ncbi:MAG: hypothetical protein BWZ10_02425 [candidate division BRC1 bacterium ADurb.BinA364]|nr:MAG: hypothetical protein BWZ10_02425 [candidate division BRC1 bacterium ADurb.BinA364]
MKRSPALAALAAVWLLALEQSARAYLDPGSGSMILQLVLGALAATAVALRAFWTQIKALFGLRSAEKRRDGGNGGANPPNDRESGQ